MFDQKYGNGSQPNGYKYAEEKMNIRRGDIIRARFDQSKFLWSSSSFWNFNFQQELYYEPVNYQL